MVFVKEKELILPSEDYRSFSSDSFLNSENKNLLSKRFDDLANILFIIDQVPGSKKIFEFGAELTSTRRTNLYSGEIGQYLVSQFSDEIPYFAFDTNHKKTFLEDLKRIFFIKKRGLKKDFFKNLESRLRTFDEMQNLIFETLREDQTPIIISTNTVYAGFDEKYNFFKFPGLHIHQFYNEDLHHLTKLKLEEDMDIYSENRLLSFYGRYFGGLSKKETVQKELIYAVDLKSKPYVCSCENNKNHLFDRSLAVWNG